MKKEKDTTELIIKDLKRIIVHQVQAKTSKKDSIAETIDKLLIFNDEEKNKLIERMDESFNKSSKTFKLDFDDKGDKSIYSFLKKIKTTSDDDFIKFSIDIANKLAKSHFSSNIPSGLCLIGEGVTSNSETIFFIIKAELQEVFNIVSNSLKLIKNVFLSPAKDFYKIGFFIEDGNDFIPYVYDDQFTLQKKDLTEYFYSNFLGLTTDKSDKLKTKNFFEDTKSFIEDNIENITDRLGAIKALTVLYREETSGIISPKSFSDSYFEGSLKDNFEKLIKDTYPKPFTKDISLIKHRLELQRISIPLTYSISITGSSNDLESIEVLSDPSIENIRSIEPEINSGMVKKVVILKQVKK